MMPIARLVMRSGIFVPFSKKNTLFCLFFSVFALLFQNNLLNLQYRKKDNINNIKNNNIMKTYTINKKRDGERFGRVIESGLTLREAHAELLDLFNREFDTMYSNWGMAVNATRHKVDGACKTFKDGTRTFSYDVYTYWIEEEIEEECE